MQRSGRYQRSAWSQIAISYHIGYGAGHQQEIQVIKNMDPTTTNTFYLVIVLEPHQNTASLICWTPPEQMVFLLPSRTIYLLVRICKLSVPSNPPDSGREKISSHGARG